MFSRFSVKAITLLSLLFGLFVLSPLFYSVAHAEQRTCCTDAGGGFASGNCDGCRVEGKETKNNGSTCAPGANCEVCGAQYPRSNSCGGGQSSGSSGINTATMCKYFGITPTTATVQVGKTTSIGFTVQQGSWDKLTVVNPSPTIAVSSPTEFNNKSLLIPPTTYQTLFLTITGLKVGTTTMQINQYATYPGYLNLYCSRPFVITVIAPATPIPTPRPTVQPTAVPNVCIPGARCESSNGYRVQAGASVTCSMPKATATVSNAVLSYELSCSYVNASGATVGTPINQSTTTVSGSRAVFASFPVSYTSGKYKCSFRNCTTINSVKTCGAWGK